MEKSPLTGGASKEVMRISSDFIIKLYAPYVDVSSYFKNIPEVIVYECLDTGYQWYHPATLAGDGKFYEALSKEQLYYLPWKWEHEVTNEYVLKGDTVYELGCATGDFLVKLMNDKHIQAIGTEINTEAKQTAMSRGIQFKQVENADVTCAFQVLEHIADVSNFINHAVQATKPGGYIIFAIPNNDSFIKNDPTCFLNMPPHHMGRWRAASLEKAARFFNLNVKEIRTEHLQSHHYRYYYQVRFGDLLRPFGVLGKICNKIIYTLCWPYIALRAKTITGHTILVVYQKQTA